MASFYLSAFADEAADSLTDQIRALVDNGIHYLEPRNIDGRGILTLTDEELDAMKAELDAAGITVGSIGSPIGKYPIDAPMEPHMKDLARACEVAHRLGTTRIRMFIDLQSLCRAGRTVKLMYRNVVSHDNGTSPVFR